MFEVTLMGVVGVVLLKLLTLIDYSYIKLHFSITLCRSKILGDH